MYRGQFFTAFTIGFAAALAAMSIVAGIVVCFFWHQPVWYVANQLGPLGDHLSPLYFGIALSTTGIALAYWIIQARLAWAHWHANRAIGEISHDYQALVQINGAERANEILRSRLVDVMAREHLL